MNKKAIEQANDHDMASSINAIRRAAKRARQVAAQTGTALIVRHGERIERVMVAGLESLAVDTSIKNLAEQHDSYLYGVSKQGKL